MGGGLSRFEALVPRGETVLDQRHDHLDAGADEALAAVGQAMLIPVANAEQARFVGLRIARGDAGEFDRETMRARVGIGQRAPSDCSAATSPACFADEGGRALQTPMTSPACASLLSQAMKVLASFEGVRHLG